MLSPGALVIIKVWGTSGVQGDPQEVQGSKWSIRGFVLHSPFEPSEVLREQQGFFGNLSDPLKLTKRIFAPIQDALGHVPWYLKKLWSSDKNHSVKLAIT